MSAFSPWSYPFSPDRHTYNQTANLHFNKTRGKLTLRKVFPDTKLSNLLVTLCRDLLCGFSSPLGKKYEVVYYVWIHCLTYGVHYLTGGVGAIHK